MNRWNIVEFFYNLIMLLFAVGDSLGRMILSMARYIQIRSRLLIKKIAGWRRVGDFYIGLIEKFEKNHNRITELVEEGLMDLDPKKRFEYENCKSKISAIIRARKRFDKNNLASSRLISFHRQAYMFEKRFKAEHQREHAQLQASS